MMNNEEFERKMEFIVNQQAQFVVDIERLRERQDQTEQIVNRLAYMTNEGFKQTGEKIAALIDSQMRTDERVAATHAATEEELKALAAAQRRTEVSLQKFLRSLRQGRNGK